MTADCDRCGHRFDTEWPGVGIIGRNEAEENHCPAAQRRMVRAA